MYIMQILTMTVSSNLKRQIIRVMILCLIKIFPQKVSKVFDRADRFNDKCKTVKRNCL